MERRVKNDAYRFYRQFILRYWCRKASPLHRLLFGSIFNAASLLYPRAFIKTA